MSLSSELKVYCKGRVKMPLYIKPILIYFAVISLAAVVITVKDKRAAVKGKWRVPEATLMLVGLFGGDSNARDDESDTPQDKAHEIHGRSAARDSSPGCAAVPLGMAAAALKLDYAFVLTFLRALLTGTPMTMPTAISTRALMPNAARMYLVSPPKLTEPAPTSLL